MFRFKDKQYSSGGATSGLTSSLAFTPVQVSFLFFSLDLDLQIITLTSNLMFVCAGD